ncbi:MAG: flagellar motor protein MotB [Gammaproteobacteria bacterium]
MSKTNDKHEQTVIKRGGGRHHDDEHGGAWKVAFADFCLALMALFLVLWLMASREKEAIQSVIRDAAAAGQLEGNGKSAQIGNGPNGSLIERFPQEHSGDAQTSKQGEVSYDSPSDLAALSKALQKMSADAGLASNLAAVVTPFGLRVMLHDTEQQGMFMRGSALPTGRFASLLQKMGPLFAQMKNQMLVVGHTDSVQYAAADKGGMSNWSLSASRAMAARAELLKGGMRTHSVLQVVGMADRAPLDAARTEAGLNRRIELVILTSAQARSVADMFGAPGASEALTDGASTSSAATLEQRKLRRQLAN